MDFLFEQIKYNNLKFDNIDLWDPTKDKNGAHCIPDNIMNMCNQLLIIDYEMFYRLCNNKPSQIINFCKFNYLWVYADIDGLYKSLKNQENILKLDHLLSRKNSLVMFFDGFINDNDHPLRQLSNINIVTFKINFFHQFPRIKGGSVAKNSNAKDYMITMRKKHNSIHRDLLWHHLQANGDLLDKGNVIYNTVETKRENWLGDNSYPVKWWDGQPSMDLYRDSLLEIVPETFYHDYFFTTEKTIKPIATKTPFIILSTPGYLKYLKSYGFKTFDSLISERYDSIDNLEDRVIEIVNVLKDIIKNGSYEFYHASEDILVHNQNVLFELSGKRRYETDRIIIDNLKNAEIICDNLSQSINRFNLD